MEEHKQDIQQSTSKIEQPQAVNADIPAADGTGAESNSAESEEVENARPARGGWSVAAFVVTVLAWVALPLNYGVALGGGAVALVLSIIALRQRRGAWRNLALVSIVASVVLLLVLAIFLAGIFLVLRNI